MINTANHDGVLVVELDHGKVNALDLDLLNAILDAFGAAGPAQPVVLTATGRAFSAGVDLRRIIDEGPSYTTAFLKALSRCFLAVFDHPAPVVAAINGPAIAGGCVIAASCDRRLISRGPIGLAELAVGVPFPTAALEIMRGLVGPRVGDLVLGARTFDAADAQAIGLVDEVVPPDDALRNRAIEQARTWLALPEGVFAHTKQQLQRPVRERITAHAPAEDVLAVELWTTPGVRDAIAHYMTSLARS